MKRAPLVVLGERSSWERFVERGLGKVVAAYFIASTKVSTIPGMSLAGATPELTLYTPALDVEYLVLGKPRRMNVVPTTPEGIPTPALLTRVALGLAKIPYVVVDCGSYVDPLIPHVDIGGRVVGGRIDVEDALPEGAAPELFENSRTLGRMLGSEDLLLVLGESMPGGTTTAMAIMESLGYRATGRVSSAFPRNPHELKKAVLEKAVARVGKSLPLRDVFEAVTHFGDPLHVSLAGFLAGALEAGSRVLLAGGTQMCSVLAIARSMEVDLRGRVAIGTTRWVVKDASSDILGLVRDIAPEVPVVYVDVELSKAPYSGLRAYEEGFVKEGVGAGGTILISVLTRDLSEDELLEAVYEEYGRIVGNGRES
ncbi:MAG: TIGR00303 family protein [Sulfolobales archaeon]|nr:TIGR00303 family protein [Sulfolobales archaeon]MCX8208328.1 TIGR00303 family protein [Sulfolobales archaeon]MDW8010669.1 TIGR00303 family protein [Sulfolobales archaeon]